MAHEDQYRFHPAWKAALRHVKEQILELTPPKDLTPAVRPRSAWSRGQLDCIDIIETEISKTEK